MRVPSERQRVTKRGRRRTKIVPESETLAPVALVKILLYMPAELVRRIKLEAVDRDEEIARESRESRSKAANDESGVVAIRGMSGVVAQVMTGHFGLVDLMEESRREQ